MEAAVADAPAPVQFEAQAQIAGADQAQQIPGLQNGVATAPLGAQYAPADPMQVVPANGQPAAADASGAATQAAAEPERKRRHKWGPPAAGEFAKEEQRPKKRRSRWETSTDVVIATSKAGQIIIPGQLPKEVTICGGMKVSKFCTQQPGDGLFGLVSAQCAGLLWQVQPAMAECSETLAMLAKQQSGAAVPPNFEQTCSFREPSGHLMQGKSVTEAPDCQIVPLPGWPCLLPGAR